MCGPSHWVPKGCRRTCVVLTDALVGMRKRTTGPMADVGGADLERTPVRVSSVKTAWVSGRGCVPPLSRRKT